MRNSKYVLLTLFLTYCGFTGCRVWGAGNSRTATVKKPPIVESLRRNFAFRSGGNNLVVTFSMLRDPPRSNNGSSRWQNVKLVVFYRSSVSVRNVSSSELRDNNLAEIVANGTSDYSEQNQPDEGYDSVVTTPLPENGVILSTIETTCRYSANREYLCPTPNLSRLFPNFTADNLDNDLTVVVLRTLQLGGCGTNGSLYNGRILCFAIMVDGQLAPVRRHHSRRGGTNFVRAWGQDDDERLSAFTIKYYPDPVLTTSALLPPNNLISVSGYGFDLPEWQLRVPPEIQLQARIRGENDTVPISCNTTYRNAHENGFMCVFEPSQLSTFSGRFNQLEITVTFGEWSQTCNLTFERRTRPSNDFRYFPPPSPDGRRIVNGTRDFGSGRRNRNPQITQEPSNGRWSWWENPPPPPPPPPPSGGVWQNNHWFPGRNGTNSTNETINVVRSERFFWREAFSRFEAMSNTTTVPYSDSTHMIVKIVVPIGAVCLVILVSIALLCCLRRTPLRETKFLTFIFPPTKQLLKAMPLDEMQRFSLKLLPAEMISSLANHRIEKSRLIIGGNDLGEGFFGIVKSAILYPRSKQSPLSVSVSNPESRSNQNSGSDETPLKVAVKTIQRYENLERMKEFFEEAIIMFSLHHPNVLSAIGFVDDLDGYPAIILPLMDNGNLHEFVRTKTEFNDNLLYNFAWQIAQGMSYLSSLKLVHRDLAARNCLLNKRLLVKVSDFGLTRHSEKLNYEYGTPEYKMLSHHRPLPIRWLAPECLESGTFTEKSDVWAFGVLLWELATRGDRPYGDMESSQIVKFVNLENGRLPKTPGMSSELYELMSKCWREHSSERPTFTELVDVMKVLSDDQAQCDYCDPHGQITEGNCFGKVPALEKAASFTSDIPSMRSLVTNVTSLPISLLTTADTSQIILDCICLDSESNSSSQNSSMVD